MNELVLFAGAGGGILGGLLLGWKTVCAVEIDCYAASVLAQRQNEGALAPFPIWDDVQTFDGRPWRGVVDVVSGGFPCQDISAAGRGAGIEGKRSGLWREMARIIGEVRPRYAWMENSPMLIQRGLAVVLGDLCEMGYDARWGIVSAADAGAPHLRKRIWILAYSNCLDRRNVECRKQKKTRPHDTSIRASEHTVNVAEMANSAVVRNGWWTTEPDVGRVAHGVAARMDRLKAIGNGQVPAVVKLAWNILRKLEG